MKKVPPCLLSILLLFTLTSVAQENADSAKILSEVVVKAFEQNRSLKDVPAAINYIGPSQLKRFNNTNILPALNATPGVKMEERSPGSYRMNIRGSSLRAPFGVRNVKVYFNDIPYTDPGGNSYLNQLGYYNFNSIEVIKGPGSSLYGSGTGGVILIRSEAESWEQGLGIDYTTGSYGLHNVNVQLKAGKEKFHHTVNYQHQVSQGYRDHTELKRDVLAWNSVTRIKTGELRTHVLFGDLFYETPGALTLAEYNANRKAARPAVGQFPSAEAAKAAIFQKTILGGVVLDQRISSKWHNTTAVYAAHTQLKNPTFRNYGRTSEPHGGGRTVFTLSTNAGKVKMTWHNGAEFQTTRIKFWAYSNLAGNPNIINTDNRIYNKQYFIFSQLSLDISNDWILTMGVSLNKLKVRIDSLFPGPKTTYRRIYSNELAPKVALLKKINNNVSAYASLSRGFSPPTTAEVLPSSNVINTELEAESGYNYEVGAKGALMNGRFFFDINAFYFKLNNTIVQRRDASGGDIFVNAGSTDQKGIETYLSYQLLSGSGGGFLRSAKCFVSHTWHRFRYKDFKQVNNDFSGKALPSVPPQQAVLGIDLVTVKNTYANITFSYTDDIPLNDANTDKADAYQVLDVRVGHVFLLKKKHNVEIYAGVNNVLSQEYSLGNDINAFGARYYNAAAVINYFGGVRFYFRN
jgi:iron complex outermembrane recepter protein